jgi:hypothetical protein
MEIIEVFPVSYVKTQAELKMPLVLEKLMQRVRVGMLEHVLKQEHSVRVFCDGVIDIDGIDFNAEDGHPFHNADISLTA